VLHVPLTCVLRACRFVAQNFDTLTTHASKTFQLAANNADTATLAKVALEHWEEGTIRCQWVNYLNKPSELNPLILQMPGHTAPINKVTFTSDGLRIMSASMDSTIRLWDAFSGELIGTIQAHLLPIHSAAFVEGDGGMNVRGVISSSDQFAVTASRDKSIKVWHLDSSKQIKEYTGHVGRVLCCTVKVRKEYDEETEEMVKRTYIATGSWDRSCMIWDLETGEVLQCLGGPEKLNTSDSEGHYNAVTDCCFSPDGSVLCTGSDDETIKLWNWVS
jgi:COMPASS component SWD3